MFEYLLKYYIVNRYEFFRNSFEDENPARKTRVNERSERERRYLSYEQQLNLIIMDLITFIAWTYIWPNSKLPPASFPLLLLFPEFTPAIYMQKFWPARVIFHPQTPDRTLLISLFKITTARTLLDCAYIKEMDILLYCESTRTPSILLKYSSIFVFLILSHFSHSNHLCYIIDLKERKKKYSGDASSFTIYRRNDR